MSVRKPPDDLALIFELSCRRPPPALYQIYFFRLTLYEEDTTLEYTIETYFSHQDHLFTPFRRQHAPRATCIDVKVTMRTAVERRQHGAYIAVLLGLSEYNTICPSHGEDLNSGRSQRLCDHEWYASQGQTDDVLSAGLLASLFRTLCFMSLSHIGTDVCLVVSLQSMSGYIT